jgi:hypothetical protein
MKVWAFGTIKNALFFERKQGRFCVPGYEIELPSNKRLALSHPIRKFISSGENPRWLGILLSGSSSVGRATASQAVGRGFETRFPLVHEKQKKPEILRLLF